MAQDQQTSLWAEHITDTHTHTHTHTHTRQRRVRNIVVKGQGIYPVVCGIDIINSDPDSPLDLALLSYLSSRAALSHPVQGVTHATLAAFVHNDTEQTPSLCRARSTFGEGEIISVCACRHWQTGVAWWEMDMRRGCEAESVCGASARFAVVGVVGVG